LRDAESSVISEDDQLRVDDGVRTDGSPVLGNLTGDTSARSVLEAMITHSDNTATDMALLHVGPDRVRALIAEQKLAATLIPDSTRRFFSYNVGAPLGVDIGWSGVRQVLESQRALRPPRRPLNDQVTLASSADDLVTYYKRAFAGSLFAKRSTLSEFKRIHMSNTFFPEDTIGYGKGGSGNWFGDSMVAGDFHAISYAGQMVVNATPATFCFVANWTGEDPLLDTDMFVPAFTDIVRGSTRAIKQILLR
jgi:beta-lactamase class A